MVRSTDSQVSLNSCAHHQEYGGTHCDPETQQILTHCDPETQQILTHCDPGKYTKLKKYLIKQYKFYFWQLILNKSIYSVYKMNL